MRGMKILGQLRACLPSNLGMVPGMGVEPIRPFGQRILSPQRLPFRHPGK